MSGTDSETLTAQSAGEKKGKVLIVDDEEYVRGILVTMLGAMGYEAEEASDGDHGLSTFSTSGDTFVACVIDLTMHGMGGVELLERIREVDADVPVLLVSGYSPHEVRQKEAKSSNVSFLQKPFTLDQFTASMNACLSIDP